jgi:hypothetical protein
MNAVVCIFLKRRGVKKVLVNANGLHELFIDINFE